MSEEQKPEAPKPAYTNLPTDWIVIATDGMFLSSNLGRMELARISRAALTKSGPAARFDLAKCHFKIGMHGEKQYFTEFHQIPELHRCRPDPDCPELGLPIITEIYEYGIKLTREELNRRMKGNK